MDGIGAAGRTARAKRQSGSGRRPRGQRWLHINMIFVECVCAARVMRSVPVRPQHS